MRPCHLAIFLTLATGSFARVSAQQPHWDTGAFIQFGLRYTSTPRDDAAQLPGVAGLYAEWLSPPHLSHVNLGLELRADQGVLVGPRISVGGDGPWHAYIGGLFGPTQSTYNPGTIIYPAGTPPPDNTRYGVTSEAVFGVEHDLCGNLRWRIVELSAANFSGISGSHPFTIQTGVVLHLRRRNS
jgi:hypothetical protein